MTKKVYIIHIDDRIYEDGYFYDVCAFDTISEAENLKQKIEHVFSYVEQRAEKFCLKFPTIYPMKVHSTLFNYIKKKENMYFLKKVLPSEHYESGPTIYINEIQLHSSIIDMKGTN